MYNVAIDILNILNKNGYDAYIVGGYPRDLLLKINSSDIDICTSATPDIIKNLFIVIEDNSRFINRKRNNDSEIQADETLLKELKEMGFPENRSRQDLINTRNNMEIATEMLLEETE